MRFALSNHKHWLVLTTDRQWHFTSQDFSQHLLVKVMNMLSLQVPWLSTQRPKGQNVQGETLVSGFCNYFITSKSSILKVVHRLISKCFHVLWPYVEATHISFVAKIIILLLMFPVMVTDNMVFAQEKSHSLFLSAVICKEGWCMGKHWCMLHTSLYILFYITVFTLYSIG